MQQRGVLFLGFNYPKILSTLKHCRNIELSQSDANNTSFVSVCWHVNEGIFRYFIWPQLFYVNIVNILQCCSNEEILCKCDEVYCRASSGCSKILTFRLIEWNDKPSLIERWERPTYLAFSYFESVMQRSIICCNRHLLHLVWSLLILVVFDYCPVSSSVIYRP